MLLTLCFIVLAIRAWMMLRDDERAWIAIPIALLLGLAVFIGNVDFSSPLEFSSDDHRNRCRHTAAAEQEPGNDQGPELRRLVPALTITLAVYWYEFSKQSLPCTLCLLQRIAMIGVAFGAALNLKLGPKLRQLGRVWAERLPQRRGLELVAVLSATIRRRTS